MIEPIVQVCANLLADWMRNRPAGGGDTAPRAHQEDGCPACRLHSELADSKAYLEAMVLEADPDGRVPGELAATVRLAEMHLELAATKLDAVVESRPDLAGRAQDLRTRITDARSSLPRREAITRSTAEAARVTVTACWEDAVRLARTYFTAPSVPPALDRVREAALELPPADRERLIASLRP